MVIYMTINKINGKKYIGKDMKNNPNYLGSGIHLKRAIIKYGNQNFIKEILEYCETKEQLNEREKYWINFYDAVKSNDFYNIANGGDGGNTTVGFDKNEMIEYKKKISKSLKGKKRNDKTRKKMSDSRMGIIYTTETRNKISESVKKLWENENYRKNHIDKIKGIKRGPRSDEIKNKISISTMGKNKGKIPWNKGKHGYLKITDEFRNKLSILHSGEKNPSFGKKWMNKDGKNIYIKKELTDDYLKNGYKFGMIKKNIK